MVVVRHGEEQWPIESSSMTRWRGGWGDVSVKGEDEAAGRPWRVCGQLEQRGSGRVPGRQGCEARHCCCHGEAMAVSSRLAAERLGRREGWRQLDRSSRRRAAGEKMEQRRQWLHYLYVRLGLGLAARPTADGGDPRKACPGHVSCIHGVKARVRGCARRAQDRCLGVACYS